MSHKRMAVLTALVILCGGSGRALGQGSDSASPLPEFTGARVYVSGVPDVYGPVRDEIASLEHSSPQTYYVVVVRSTGIGPKSTRPYLERMVENWETQARRKALAFDKARCVIILVAINNRQVIVLGGEDLQERLGFRDPYIERDLLQPHFFPYARSGDYVRGLRVLLAQIDRWITQHDKDLARRSAEAAAREARLKGDAQAAVDGARRLLDETRKELSAKEAAGLQAAALDSQVRAAAADLDAASQRLAISPSEALDLAQKSQHALVGVMDALRRSSLQQAESDRAIHAASGQAAAVLSAIEQASRAGLPVAALQAELDAANAQLEQARRRLVPEPDKAATLAAQAGRALQAALEHARLLPELQRQVTAKAAAVTALERAAGSELDRARRSGVAQGDLQARWDRASQTLKTARAAAGNDPSRALAAFNEAETLLGELQLTARTRLARHLFLTRTLPLTVFGLIVLAVLGVLGLTWLWKRRLQARFDRQFKGFREKAVGLMDRLDALRQRHKSLLATDPDYTQPLAGATLTLYKEVERDLSGLWDHWLRIMEVWDQAQRLVRAGSGTAMAKIEEARTLIEKEGDFAALLQTCDGCAARLDRLNQAHEQARADSQSARAEVAALRQTLEAIAAAGLPTDTSTSELVKIEGLLTQAEGLLQADPIGAGEAVAHSREALRALADKAGQTLARFHDATAAAAAIDAVAARAAELRSQGLKLTEDQANPDPALAEARRRQAAALEALRRADPAAAATRIDEATALIEQARQAIDRHLQARDTVRQELPARRAVAQRLEEAALKTETILEELRQGFASTSWSDVADHLESAHALLRSIDEHLARAEDAASDRVQDYLRAAALAAETGRDQDRVDQLLRAVADRHAALAALESEARTRAAALEDEVQRVAAFCREHGEAVAPEALQALDQTVAAYRELTGLMAQRRPDWPEICRRIDIVGQGAATALRQAREDVESHRRFLEQLDQVKQRAEAVGSLLQQEDKDRPPANQRYRAAMADLAALESGSGNGAGADHQWERGLRRIADIEGSLKWAEELARKDITQAHGAIAAITEAERIIRAARTYYEYGITVDVSAAEDHLARARGALATQAYEQAIEHADAAERAARDAHEAAAAEALRRRRQVERDRAFTVNDPTLIIAAAQAAAQMAMNWANEAGAGGFSMPSSPSPPPAPSFPQTSSPAESWGSGSGGGNWTSGADQAGW
jgi:hypothetical protein